MPIPAFAITRSRLPVALVALTLATLSLAATGPARADGERCVADGVPIEAAPDVVMVGRTGVVRCDRLSDGKPAREFQYEEGRLVRQREWNDLGQRLDIQFHGNGAVRSRLREVVYHGRPAWDREDFWESGLLRLRGTYLQGGQAQGLVQVFHESGPLALESWYDEGRMLRKKAFSPEGRQTLDEEYLPDGSVKSTMRRF